MQGTTGRYLVVGASVSIGATIAIEASRRGTVTIAARRVAKLEEVAAQCQGEVHIAACDVTDPDQCVQVVADAVEAMGGLDYLVYVPALFPLGNLADFDAATWTACFDTNVRGAALVTRAALPHLVSTRGKAAYFVSDSTFETPHWPGLGVYSVTKVALNRLVECWRYEVPDVGFTIVQVGATEGSEGPLAGGWTPDQVEAFAATWHATGRVPSELQSREVVAGVVLDALCSESMIDFVSVAPPKSVGVSPQE